MNKERNEYSHPRLSFLVQNVQQNRIVNTTRRIVEMADLINMVITTEEANRKAWAIWRGASNLQDASMEYFLEIHNPKASPRCAQLSWIWKFINQVAKGCASSYSELCNNNCFFPFVANPPQHFVSRAERLVRIIFSCTNYAIACAECIMWEKVWCTSNNLYFLLSSISMPCYGHIFCVTR